MVNQANTKQTHQSVQQKQLQETIKMIFTPVLHQPHMAALARASYLFLKDTHQDD